MPHTILVVDDSPSVVKFVSFSLRHSGFKVITAGDGMDALEKLSGTDCHVDMVITDLNMPNMDGFELIGTLRQNAEFDETPIIILSSERGEEDKLQGEAVGANSYLVKPFKSSILLYEVAKYLN